MTPCIALLVTPASSIWYELKIIKNLFMSEVEFTLPLPPQEEGGGIDSVIFLFLYRRKLLHFFPFAGGIFPKEENIVIN